VSTSAAPSARSGHRPLSPSAAAAVVFVASGAVLVLEILSLRLVAPYVGLTLEVSSAVIGCALAAITVGSWVGGRVADLLPPQKLVGPLLLAAAVLVLLIGPLVRWAGDAAEYGDTSGVMATAFVTVFLPAALLTAVHPMIVKLQLGALDETGTVVGRLSGIGTAGALAGTFLTGFVLIGRQPVSRILFALGALIALLGVVLTAYWLSRPLAAGGTGAAVLAAGTIAIAPQPCDVETKYHCARVLIDDARPTARTLQLDTLWHSYVDLEDPRLLRFAYVRSIASVIGATFDGDEPVRVLHVGGGGASMARYLHATRPGSDNLVIEIDPGVVDLDREQLGLREGDGLQVKVQDGRLAIAQQRDGSRDVVIGDAFGGVSVPWHLTTRETVEDIRRVLTDDGVYVLNVIDYPPLGFARAEAATLADVFAHVGVIADAGALDHKAGGNLVLVASDEPLPLERLRDALQDRVPEFTLFAGEEEVSRFVGDADVLTDDFAPVDQLLTPRVR
jgi:hypothetical protein